MASCNSMVHHMRELPKIEQFPNRAESKILHLLYGMLGYICLQLSEKIWDEQTTSLKNFPAFFSTIKPILLKYKLFLVWLKIYSSQQ